MDCFEFDEFPLIDNGKFFGGSDRFLLMTDAGIRPLVTVVETLFELLIFDSFIAFGDFIEIFGRVVLSDILLSLFDVKMLDIDDIVLLPVFVDTLGPALFILEVEMLVVDGIDDKFNGSNVLLDLRSADARSSTEMKLGKLGWLVLLKGSSFRYFELVGLEFIGKSGRKLAEGFPGNPEVLETPSISDPSGDKIPPPLIAVGEGNG